MQHTILSPEEFTREVEEALSECSTTEAVRLVEHAKAWAIDRYEGDIPLELARRHNLLEARCHTLTMRADG